MRSGALLPAIVDGGNDAIRIEEQGPSRDHIEDRGLRAQETNHAAILDGSGEVWGARAIRHAWRTLIIHE